MVALPSSDPYICVASDIPGRPYHEQYSSILLSLPSYTGTTEEAIYDILTDPSNKQQGSRLSKFYKHNIQESEEPCRKKYIIKLELSGKSK